MRDLFLRLLFTALNPHPFMLSLESIKKSWQDSNVNKECSKYLNTNDLPELMSLKKSRTQLCLPNLEEDKLAWIAFWKGSTLEIQSSRNWRAYHFISTFLWILVMTIEAATISCLQHINCYFPSIQQGTARLRANEGKRKDYPLCYNRTKDSWFTSTFGTLFRGRGWRGGGNKGL